MTLSDVAQLGTGIMLSKRAEFVVTNLTWGESARHVCTYTLISRCMVLVPQAKPPKDTLQFFNTKTNIDLPR